MASDPEVAARAAAAMKDIARSLMFHLEEVPEVQALEFAFVRDNQEAEFIVEVGFPLSSLVLSLSYQSIANRPQPPITIIVRTRPDAEYLKAKLEARRSDAFKFNGDDLEWNFPLPAKLPLERAICVPITVRVLYLGDGKLDFSEPPESRMITIQRLRDEQLEQNQRGPFDVPILDALPAQTVPQVTPESTAETASGIGQSGTEEEEGQWEGEFRAVLPMVERWWASFLEFCLRHACPSDD
ncbi:uncharacterized protein BO97DRAFT_278594 [Aspergillus homomorphus CBS 101889]|uniref:Uncharacterized protein n=1 Tax=Aspergillus homomorphus (strain CBS 101889) TaxID=1450537 RepID=A0A395HGH1_ASPHC|nr:hypothetical protein BO97DRAFT_278594 [Aspergillus homomorphus CBS 101889]RAL06850.1 hypothetical protein BO97DRAFT_278594 [Aspergillus homomorphus CBS 101889]